MRTVCPVLTKPRARRHEQLGAKDRLRGDDLELQPLRIRALPGRGL
jgi:hypothetical protein